MTTSRPWTGAALLALLLAGVSQAEEPAKASEAAQRIIEELGLRESGQAMRDLPGKSPLTRIAVYVPGRFRSDPEAYLDGYRDVAAGASVHGYDGRAESLPEGTDAVIGFCSPGVVAAAPELRWLHSLSVGVERCTLSDSVKERSFILTNNQRLSGPDIAEHALALMFALARNLDGYVRLQSDGQWQPIEQRSVNLSGRTLLVLGLGGIGTEVARRAAALGMRVIATRNSSRNGPPFVDRVGLASETHELAAEADFIVNALPLTDATRGVVNAAFFDATKPGAYYISVGRGGSTDTEALMAALDSGHLEGAGLDVTDPEPLPADHPLWQMDNVLITPHVAAFTDDAPVRSHIIAIENLRRFQQGEPLLSRVDFERGY